VNLICSIQLLCSKSQARKNSVNEVAFFTPTHENFKIDPAPDSVVEDETMARTVHRLQSELFLLDLEPEHVLGVVIPVAGGLPQPGVVDVW
jgi:hypothetical protein